jgi:3-phytase
MKKTSFTTFKQLWAIHFLGLALLSMAFVTSCSSQSGNENILAVHATAQTTPTEADVRDDAADDPAIWIHPTAIEKSIIIGTNKKLGLETYQLTGERIATYPEGRMNNVDVRYSFPMGSRNIDIAAASNRTTNTLDVWQIKESGELIKLKTSGDKTSLQEVYGFCLGQINSTLFAFVSDKGGLIEQWSFAYDSTCSCIKQSIVDTFKLQSQIEGLVVDEEEQTLFAAVEEAGIYAFDLGKPMANPQFINQSDEENTNIKYDVEGLALYYLPQGEGYLIASSQGNNSYAIFNRKEPHEYLGSFQVTAADIDGVSDTDGIDVTNQAFGSIYPSGLFICQDGSNTDSGEKQSQNFKLVHWEDIANVFDPKLTIDTEYKAKNSE